MSENTNKSWQEREVAALWFKQQKGDSKMYTGYMNVKNEQGETVRRDLVAFLSKPDPENERRPDLKIYESLPFDGNKQSNTGSSNGNTNAGNNNDVDF